MYVHIRALKASAEITHVVYVCMCMYTRIIRPRRDLHFKKSPRETEGKRERERERELAAFQTMIYEELARAIAKPYARE